jgi:hypothetical protein
MGLNKRAVHQLKEVMSRTGGKVSIIDKVTPYLRFVQDSEKILVCDGALYYENETRVPNDKIPKWFWGCWDNVNDKGRAKVNGEKVETLRAALAAPVEKLEIPEVEHFVGRFSEPTRKKKKAKKKAGKKRGRRKVMATPSPEANTSETVNDGITS